MERPDPLEVLAFIESGMSMTAEQRAARWPEWHKMSREAHARYERECSPVGRDRRPRLSPGSAMVDSIGSAQHHWVYLPLIRAALTAKEAPATAHPQGAK
jgi:hypothetical protein